MFTELEELNRYGGLAVLEALKAATVTGARALGVADDFGSIEVGKVADLLVLEANPLDNLANLQRVAYVIKDGRIVRDP